MRCQVVALIVFSSVFSCKSGEKTNGEVDQRITTAPQPGSRLADNAREALAELLARESSSGVVSWADFRRLDELIAGKPISQAAAVTQIAALEGLVRGLWARASSRASADDVTAADIEAAAEIGAVELTAGDKAALARLASELGLRGYPDERRTAEHWRIVVAVIASEIHLGGPEPVKPLGGKALEALASATTALSHHLLSRSVTRAVEVGAAAIEPDHVKAAYQTLATELEIANRPRDVAPLSPMDVARLLIPLSRTLVENKARALAASDRASGNLAADLAPIVGAPVTADAAEALFAAARSVAARATTAAFYVDHARAHGVIQRSFPHAFVEGGDALIRLEPDPRPAIGGPVDPLELRVPAAAIRAVRHSAAHWRAMAETLAAAPYAVDPLAAEMIADATAVKIAALALRAAGRVSESGAAIDAEVAGAVLGEARVPVPPRPRDRVWTDEHRERKARVIAGASRRFADVTEAVGLPAPVDASPLGSGIAAGDVDGDGHVDLFLGGSGKLMRNRGERQIRFEDVTSEMGLPADLGGSAGVLLFDLEGDGDLDLLVLRRESPSAIYRLDAGRYTDATAELGLETRRGAQAAHVFDHDGDGDLDLFVGYHGGGDETDAVSRDQLWRNDGGALVEVGADAGIGGAGWTLGVASFDLEMDGDADLYVAAERGASALYRNDGGGIFTEIAAATGTADRDAAAGVTPVDANGDGAWDLYVTGVDMYARRAEMVFPRGGSTADIDAALASSYEVLSGNKLLVSAAGAARFSAGGSIRFEPGDRGWSWGAVFADVDLDGDDDLYIANGWIPGSAAADQRNQLLIFDAGAFYLTPEEGAERFAGNSRSAVAVDLDRDGDVDLIASRLGAPPVVLENRGRGGGRWIRVSLADSTAAGNPGGLGAAVSIGGALRPITGGSGYLSQSPAEVHAGVGRARAVEVVVRWPDGAVTRHPKLATDRAHVVKR